MKKYRFPLLVFLVNLLVLVLAPATGTEAILFTGRNLLTFVFMLAPIFLLIGLMDVWIEPETLIKIIGEKSGLRGILVAFLLGAVTAVPLYALLPVSGILLKKGSRIFNVLIFLCSSASIRIPLLLFEVSSLGWKFTLTWFIANLFVVLAIATIIEKALTEKDKKSIYENANES